MILRVPLQAGESIKFTAMPGQPTLPIDFERQMIALLGEAYEDYKQSLAKPPPVSIRLNPRKPITPEGEPVAWCSSGYYLAERPAFTLDPFFHAGAYYVQEASSMFLEQVVRQAGLADNPVRILDLCAAPGGKSTHLLSLVHPQSLVVSNEVIKSRAAILAENIGKWGYANAVVTSSDPKDFGALEGFFDLILVDAPCSGEGLFRKDQAARNEWSLNTVHLCSGRQQRILDDVWPALRQNGLLIYSTCTFNPQENEGVLQSLDERYELEPISINLKSSWNIESTLGKPFGYRFFPHRVKGEGFFLAAIRKTARQKEIHINPKDKLTPLKLDQHTRITGWLLEPMEFSFIEHKNTIRMIPEVLKQEIQFLLHHVTVAEAGTALATAKHDKLVPEHTAALSVHLDKNAFQVADLSLPEALAYLRKENVVLDTCKPGFTLITYKHIPIGWVNVLPNRVNNLYPSSWRIRMQA